MNEENKGWIADHAICENCGHEWIGVYPLSCVQIECPNCHELVLAAVWDDRRKVKDFRIFRTQEGSHE
jgi:hypothetical protein